MGIMGIVDKYFIKKPLVRKFLTKWYYGDKDKTVNFFNTRLYINSVKENGYLRAYNYSNKSSVFRDEVSIIINLASFISADTTFVDVGANVGLFSSTFIRFQKLYKDVKIYAFEANPDTFKRLLRTAENTNIQLFNNAISNEEKELDFVEGVVSHVFAEKSHSNSYHLKNAGTVKVKAKRLDQFEIAGNSIMLKIDVEGHEYEVLEGAGKLFESKRIKLVYIDGYQKKEQIKNFLERFEFKLFDGKTLEPLKDTLANNFSLLAVRKIS